MNHCQDKYINTHSWQRDTLFTLLWIRSRNCQQNHIAEPLPLPTLPSGNWQQYEWNLTKESSENLIQGKNWWSCVWKLVILMCENYQYYILKADNKTSVKFWKLQILLCENCWHFCVMVVPYYSATFPHFWERENRKHCKNSKTLKLYTLCTV